MQTLDAVAFDCPRRVLARHQNAEPCAARIAPLQVEGIAVEAAPCAFTQKTLEFGFSPQPAPGIQPEAVTDRDYNPSRRRPARAGCAAPRVRRACDYGLEIHGAARAAF